MRRVLSASLLPQSDVDCTTKHTHPAQQILTKMKQPFKFSHRKMTSIEDYI